MLDDYSEDDKPDNVRIIKRDITKIIEKEVIKEVEVEVEVEVENTSEIDRLNIQLERILLQKNQIKEKSLTKEQELSETQKKISNIESDFHLYKEDMKDRLTDALKEKERLSNTNASVGNENVLIKKSMEDQQKENNDLIEKLKEDNSKLELVVGKLKKIKDNEGELIKEREDELTKEKENAENLVKDRDYFIELVEKKDKEIKVIKHDLSYEYRKHPNVHEGTDDYGKFYNISNLEGHFPKEHITKILEVSNGVDPDEFVYYGINTVNGYESLETHSIKRLDSFIERVRRKKTDGKYKIYIILDNRVYYYEIH
tara:strand:+ start:3169 stop:4110 length:942 start_codon:yes stop_codon:yes gene_type:complete